MKTWPICTKRCEKSRFLQNLILDWLREILISWGERAIIKGGKSKFLNYFQFDHLYKNNLTVVKQKKSFKNISDTKISLNIRFFVSSNSSWS